MATKTNTEINGHKYYRITRTVGHEYKDGKKVPIKKQFLGTSKRQAEMKYEEWKEAQKAPEIDCTRSIGDLCEQFVGHFENDSSYALGTRDLYKAAYKRMLKGTAFSHRAISSITSQDVQLYINSLQKTDASVRTLIKFLKLFFRWAELSGYCGDLMRLVVIPDKEKITESDEIVVWSDKEIKMIEDRLPDYDLYPLIMFGLYSGTRISEALGLKWSDIYDEQIHIVRQSYRGKIVPPKSKSVRSIPLHRKIKEALKDREHKSEYIFVSASGQLLNYNNVQRSLRRAYKRAGIPYKKYHAYRATFCTRMCERGVPLQVASKLMGHKNITITAKYYTFIEDKQKIDAISKL